ncbi:MAG: AMP-binding protein [Nodosilinea sp.]
MPALTFNGSPAIGSALTWVELLSERAAQLPAQVALRLWNDGVAAPEELTYANLDRRSRAIAAQMQQRNLRGERVLLLCPPGLDYAVAFCACLTPVKVSGCSPFA